VVPLNVAHGELARAIWQTRSPRRGEMGIAYLIANRKTRHFGVRTATPVRISVWNDALLFLFPVSH
jgi:hypothetical protein